MYSQVKNQFPFEPINIPTARNAEIFAWKYSAMYAILILGVYRFISKKSMYNAVLLSPYAPLVIITK